MRLGGSVRIGANVLTGRVVDTQVCPKLAPGPAVRWQFVGEQNASQGNVAEQEGGVLATTGQFWANVAAFGSNGTMRPTNPFEMLPTRIIIRKLLEESHDRHAETDERGLPRM
jgi:hypothetical protein